MSEKMENNWIWVALGAAVVLGGVYYFIREKGAKEPLVAEDMDKLTLAYVEDYFKKSYAPILKDKSNIQPIALKVKGDIFSNNDEESLFFALTYYDKDTEEILEGHTKYIKAKSIDVNLKDAFGDKDMFIFK